MAAKMTDGLTGFLSPRCGNEKDLANDGQVLNSGW